MIGTSQLCFNLTTITHTSCTITVRPRTSIVRVRYLFHSILIADPTAQPVSPSKLIVQLYNCGIYKLQETFFYKPRCKLSAV